MENLGEHQAESWRLSSPLPFPVVSWDTEAKEVLPRNSFLCTVSTENAPMKVRNRKISFGISPTLRKFQEKRLDFANSIDE